MIIDCISDLHGHYPKLEDGDLLIVAGDLTANDRVEGWHKFFDWLDRQNYHKKIVIAGNHDNFCKSWAISGTFTNDEHEKMYPGEKPTLDYLCDSGTEFDGLKIWGSPWTKAFPGMNPHCKAFTVDTEEELAEKWAMIPDDVDILITHSPPYAIFDRVWREGKWGNGWDNTGSVSLRNASMDRIQPQLHVFGHIHEWGGKVIDTCVTKFVNACHVNEHYQPVNKPIRIEI